MPGLALREASAETGRLTDRVGLRVSTRVVERDLVDEVLIDTGRVEQRRRLMPARVVVYFVSALTLFFDDACEEVRAKLVDGLRFPRSWEQRWQMPTATALCKARTRLGEEPLEELFRRVAVPLASAGCPGAWLAGLRVMAIDAVEMDVPDTGDNEAVFGRRRTSTGEDGPYPTGEDPGLGRARHPRDRCRPPRRGRPERPGDSAGAARRVRGGDAGHRRSRILRSRVVAPGR
ncbi:transposase domain-containing protein [Nocardia seriolae]|uniref:transposase domain-containing protein n=1 Tax=Nocardia seriolae TaxID=37332 RepID=UPI000AF218F3